ncbi:hypothetical protein TNCV_2899741 [Trichonephila clavipes]|nr:hypothetical protein TNCV_2899741 [Trichonephila clavipes]
MRVCEKWTDEHRTTRKTGIRRWQLAAHWSTTTDVLTSASSIRRCLLHRGLRARVPLYRIPPHDKPMTAASAMGS